MPNWQEANQLPMDIRGAEPETSHDKPSWWSKQGYHRILNPVVKPLSSTQTLSVVMV